MWFVALIDTIVDTTDGIGVNEFYGGCFSILHGWKFGHMPYTVALVGYSTGPMQLDCTMDTKKLCTHLMFTPKFVPTFNIPPAIVGVVRDR